MGFIMFLTEFQSYRRFIQFFKLFLTLFVLFTLTPLRSAYIPVYNTFSNGGLAFTGNALGLSRRPNANAPGFDDSVGAFTTTNPSLQVSTFPVVTGSNPGGTTLDFTLNNSSAFLDLPPNSTVLHAELIWSGTFNDDDTSFLNNNILFTPPGSSPITVSPKIDTAQTIIITTPQATKAYVRSADVTNFVTQSGKYSAGSIYGTVIPNGLNATGWTLAVAFQNMRMVPSILTIYVAAESSNGPAIEVSNFQAPASTNQSRLFISAIEGDTSRVGDQLLVGTTPNLTGALDSVFGPNNPVNNFFCSQINTSLSYIIDSITNQIDYIGSSSLDTRGTFGTRNGNAAISQNTLAQRQGYDITSIDVIPFRKYNSLNLNRNSVSYSFLGDAYAGWTSIKITQNHSRIRLLSFG